MKKSLFIFSLCATLFVTSCSENQSGGKGNLSEIDVESSFKHPQELSLFDLGKEFTYIPLETIDESLIKLNSTSNLAVTDDYIFIDEAGLLHIVNKPVENRLSSDLKKRLREIFSQRV